MWKFRVNCVFMEAVHSDATDVKSWHILRLSIWLAVAVTSGRAENDRDCIVLGEITEAPHFDYSAHTFIESRTINRELYLQEIETEKKNLFETIKVGLFTKTADIYHLRRLTNFVAGNSQTGKTLLPLDDMLLTQPDDHLGFVMNDGANIKYQEKTEVTGVSSQIIFEEGSEHTITDTSTRQYSIAVKFCTDINQCTMSTSSCFNFGTCVYEPGTFRCQCTEQFTGRNCENGALLQDMACSVEENMAVALVSGTQYYVDHSRMTASSVLDTRSDPSAFNARMDRYYHPDYTNHYWSPQNQEQKENPDDPEWLQVDLGTEFKIRKVATQGPGPDNTDVGYVTIYSLTFSLDGKTWSREMVYQGNQDYSTVVENTLYEEMIARYVRLLPKAYEGSIALRIEIYGCWEEMVDILTASEETLSELYANGIQVQASESDPPVYNFKITANMELEVIAFKLQSNSTLDDGVLVYTPELYTLSGDRSWKCLTTDAELPVQNTSPWYSKYYDDASWPDAVFATAPNIPLPDSLTNTSSVEWIWAESSNINTVVYCRGLKDACYRQPCLNNASCLDLEEGFNCTCPAGYEGRLCGTDTDECLSQPCVNGTCRDLVDGFECCCDLGFENQLCAVEIDECLSAPCLNGTCEDLLNGFQCSCDPGYKGALCSEAINECASEPCVHGSCNDLLGGYNCSCFAGFEDYLCSTKIDQCLSLPCFKGTCVSIDDGFFCACPTGFEDLLCATDTNECASEPCLHGSCLDHEGGFECVCEVGYAGTLCSIEFNQCSSNPCQYGTCFTLPGGAYECICLSGFEGVHCDSDINECQSDPCLNGDCVDFTNGFLCNCFTGFIGSLCDNETESQSLSFSSNYSVASTIDNSTFKEESSTPAQTTSGSSSVSAQANNVPEFEIVCVSNNCEKQSKLSTEDIIYKVECKSNCELVSSNITVNWLVLDSGKHQVNMTSGEQLSLPKGSLRSWDLYRLQANVDYPGGNWTGEEYIVIATAADVKLGQCAVSPKEGVELETEFTVVCSGWFSPSGGFSFVFYQRLDLNQRVKLATIEHEQSVEYKTTLMPGKESDMDQTHVEVEILDQVGGRNLLILNVIVNPTKSKEVLQQYLDDALLEGTELTASDLARMGNIIDEHTDSMDQKTINKVINKIFSTMEANEPIPVSDVGSVSYTTVATLEAVGSSITKEQVDALRMQASNLMQTLTENIKEMDASTMKEIGTCLVNLLMTCSHTMKKTLDSPSSVISKSDAAKASLEMVKKMNTLFAKIRDNLKLGEVPIEMKFSGQSVKLGKVKSSDMKYADLTSQHGGVFLPSEIFDETPSDECSSFGLVFYSKEKNPYWSETSSANDRSGVGQFDLSNCDPDDATGKRKRSVLSQFVTAVVRKYSVKITKPDYEDKMKDVAETLAQPDELVYYSMNVNGTENVHISVEPKSTSKLLIFIGFNYTPTRNNYTTMYTSPNTSVADDVKHSYFIEKEDIAKDNITTVQIGIGQDCEDPVGTKVGCHKKNITFRYTLGSFQCEHWSDESERWEMLRECENYEETKDSVKVKPKKFGAVGSLFVLKMNKLDLKMIFTNIDEKIRSNYSVLVALSISTVVFIVVLIALRRLDKKDHEKWSVIALPDNDDSHKFSYEVHFHTGIKKNGGLEGNILLAIEGEESSMEKRLLEDWESNTTRYFPGIVKGFYLTSERNLGLVTSVSLFIPKTITLNWFLEFVVVLDLQTLEWWPFFFDNWVQHTDDPSNPDQHNTDTDEEHTFLKLNDKERHFPARSMCMHNVHVTFRETHTWFSSFAKKIKSTYTRVQRWCCCILAVTGFMLLNALWFDTTLGESVNTGPTLWGVPIKEVIKSVYSTLIVSAITSIVGYLYAKTKISEKEAAMHYMSFAPISQLRTDAFLPHFVIYIVHAVVVMFILSTWFVCVLFSLQWGPHVADAWLIAFVLGTVFNIVIWEPIMIAFAMIIATCFKHKDAELGMYHVIFDRNKKKHS